MTTDPFLRTPADVEGTEEAAIEDERIRWDAYLDALAAQDDRAQCEGWRP